jgi:hypothetical protein
MTESTLTLRELFAVQPRDLSIRAESGFDANQGLQEARQKIEQTSRAIRWPWVRERVASEAQTLLNLNVVDVLLRAWKQYLEIEQYADPQKYPPTKRIPVPLATHTLQSVHHPSLEILLKGQKIGSLESDLEFSLLLEGFVLQIENAKVMEIQTGEANGKGSLSLATVSLWEQEMKPLHFPGHITFGNGIPLRRNVG